MTKQINLTISEQLQSLARDVSRLLPSRTDPERFYLEKSEIVDALRRAARAVGA